jgi:hypothetical protein
MIFKIRRYPNEATGTHEYMVDKKIGESTDIFKKSYSTLIRECIYNIQFTTRYFNYIKVGTILFINLHGTSENHELPILDGYINNIFSSIEKCLESKILKEHNIAEIYIGGDFNKTIDISQVSKAVGVDVLWGRRKLEKLIDQYNAIWNDEARDYARIAITKLALDYHLVSKFTSLVAIDVTPSRPGLEHLTTKAVTKKMDLSMFKPRQVAYKTQTATNANLWMLIGLILMVIATLLRNRRKKCSR